MAEATSHTANSRDAFVPMAPWHRAAIVSAYLVYILAVSLVARGQDRVEIWYNVGALVLHSAALLAPVLLYRREYGWFHPLIVLAWLGLLGLARQFSSYAYGLGHHRALPEYGPGQLTLLMAEYRLLDALGAFMLLVGFWLGKGVRFRRMRLCEPRDPARASVAALVLSLGVAALFAAQSGGVGRFLTELGRSRHEMLDGAHYLVLPASAGAMAWLVWLAYRPDTAPKRPLFWGVGVTALLIPGFVTFSRSAVVLPAALALVVFMIRKRRLLIGRPLLFAVAAVYVLAVMGAMRHSTWHGEVRLDGLASSPMEALEEGQGELVKRATSGHGGLAILARVPSHVDYLYGDSYIAAALNPVPRALWENKPGQTGGRVGRTFFAVSGGVPPGEVGEAYWNFGYLGIVVVFMLGGFLIRLLTNWFRANHDQPPAIVFYVLPLFGLQVTVSSALYQAKQGLVLLLVAGVFYGVRPLRRRGKRRPAGLGPRNNLGPAGLRAGR